MKIIEIFTGTRDCSRYHPDYGLNVHQLHLTVTGLRRQGLPALWNSLLFPFILEFLSALEIPLFSDGLKRTRSFIDFIKYMQCIRRIIVHRI